METDTKHPVSESQTASIPCKKKEKKGVDFGAVIGYTITNKSRGGKDHGTKSKPRI